MLSYDSASQGFEWSVAGAGGIHPVDISGDTNLTASGGLIQVGDDISVTTGGITSVHILDGDILAADLSFTGSVTDEFCVTIETSTGGFEAVTCAAGGGVHPVNVTSDITGIVPVGNGGTGVSITSDNDILVGDGAGGWALGNADNCDAQNWYRTQYNSATGDFDCDTGVITSAGLTDEFIFNTGDIGTGIFDFGGASSFEIPNGAGGTTVDALGEITIDGTTDTVNFFDGTNERVLDPERVFGITVENPDNSEDISLMRLDFPITVIWEECVLTGSLTPSLSITLRHGTDRNAAGAELVTGGNVITSTTSGDNDVTFNDATIVTDSFIWLETTAQSGTVDSASCTWGANIDE